jgi:hypothetical protein
MTNSTQVNADPFPWEQWSQLPKEEREAEMKEAMKEAMKKDNWDEDSGQYTINQGVDPDGTNLLPQYREIPSEANNKEVVDSTTDEIVGNFDTGTIWQLKMKELGHEPTGFDEGYEFETNKAEATTKTETKCEWVITTYPVPPYGHGRWVCPQKDVDPVTGQKAGEHAVPADAVTGKFYVDAVGNSNATPIPPFPHWDAAEAATDTEAVGHPRGLFPLPDLTDQLANTEDISVNPTDNNWAFENNTDFMPEPEILSPVEIDIAAPLMTDQTVVGYQLEAIGSGVCEDLRWIVPEQDLPFGCN